MRASRRDAWLPLELIRAKRDGPALTSEAIRVGDAPPTPPTLIQAVIRRPPTTEEHP